MGVVFFLMFIVVPAALVIVSLIIFSDLIKKKKNGQKPFPGEFIIGFASFCSGASPLAYMAVALYTWSQR